MLDINKTTGVDYYQRRNYFIIEKLNMLPYSEKLYAIKPFSIFCGEEFCPAVMNGEVLYSDDDHLSISGAWRVIDSLNFDR